MKKEIGPLTVLYPAPVLVVGTYDKDNRPNAMVVAWGGLCSTTPPMIAISIDENHHTYKNIFESGCFTVNIANEKYINEVDYMGMTPGRKINKFDVTGLTPRKASLVNAPYVEEFPVALECEVYEIKKVGDCMHIIGTIMNTIVDDDCLDENGVLDITKVDPLVFDSVKDEYYKMGDAVQGGFSVGDGFRHYKNKE